MGLRWIHAGRPTRAAELDDNARAQVVAYGAFCDGEMRSAEERLDGERGLYQPEQLRVVDDEGRLRYEAWLSSVDSGAVYLASTTTCVGCVVQGGFACTDLALWEALAVAARDGVGESALHGVDFSLSDDGGPSLTVVPPMLYDAIVGAPAEAYRLLGDPTLEIASAWRALRIVAQPWDGAGALTRVLTASSPSVIPGVRGLYGTAPAWFPPSEMAAIVTALVAIPDDAVERRAGALAAAIAEPAYREPGWLRRLLHDLGATVGDAAATGAGLLVSVA